MTNYRTQQNKDKAKHKVNLKFVVGGEGFPTKRAVERRARTILEETSVSNAVNRQALHLLKGLFILHPDLHQRTDEIELVRVIRNTVGFERGFESVRAEGSFTYISYRKRLRALTKLDCHKLSMIEAMRREGAYQVWQFRMAQREIAEADSLVGDHRWPWTFDHLVQNFLKSEGTSFEDIELAAEAGRMGADLLEPWHSLWADFNHAHAWLRMLPRWLNSKIGARKPPRP
jgi:hypothetical protein